MEKVLIALAKILADKKTRDKVLIFIGSIVVGFLLLLAAPILLCIRSETLTSNHLR